MSKRSMAAVNRDDTTTGADVYLRIKENILSNVFSAGAHVRESELAEQFGTSRTPVREAIVRLEAEGLIEALPKRGIRVAPISASDMREIYDILMVLESLAAGQLAATHPDTKTLSSLVASIEMMEAASKSTDFRQWAEGDDLFHRGVLELSGNSRLIAITDSLYSQANRTQTITLKLRSSFEISNAEHRDILDCISKGDEKGGFCWCAPRLLLSRLARHYAQHNRRKPWSPRG